MDLVTITAGRHQPAGVYVHARIDLTEEKRYTLSSPTRQLLANLQEPVNITIFLAGDMPAGFRKLAQSTGDILQEFQEIGIIIFNSVLRGRVKLNRQPEKHLYRFPSPPGVEPDEC
jgi:hypothetical protein